MTLALRVAGVTKRFQQHTAISGLSFEVETGEVFGLLGPNGAGKTTTLRMLAGLYAPDEGTVEVGGIAAAAHGDEVRGRIGLLTEQPGLYDRLTAEENLALFADLYGVPKAEATARIERWLRLFGLWEHRTRRAGTFSKGMRQKLAVARAVLHEPQILLLDEPTSGLDPEAARTVRDAIASLATAGRTLILCSHNLFEVERLCRRAAILRPSPEGGKLVALTEIAKLGAAEAKVAIVFDGAAEPWVEIAQKVDGVALATAEGSTLDVAFGSGVASTPALVSALAAAGARIAEVRPRVREFEDAYLRLMAEQGAA